MKMYAFISPISLILTIAIGFNCHKPPIQSSIHSEEPVITEKYWKLIRIMGHPIQKEFNREPYMILRSTSGSMKGNGGCNGFTGMYKLSALNKISFSDIISADIGCPAMETEKEFLHVLTTAESYTLNNDSLFLKRAGMDSLARFEAVYFR